MAWDDLGASLTGSLVVATPTLGDPNFRRAVIVVLDHDESGALGVVLNRPSDVPVERALPDWAAPATSPRVLFEGGPVARDSAVALASITGPIPGSVAASPGGFGGLGGSGGPGAGGFGGLGGFEAAASAAGGGEPVGWRQVSGSLGLLDLDTPPAEVTGRLAGLRIFIGYAGWGPGQLEAEIAEEAWYVVAAESGDAFSATPERLWRAVLRRQSGDLALVSTFPDDPTLN